jgi:hypothetical protein
VANLSSS